VRAIQHARQRSESILRSLGGSLSGVEPGSERAQAIKSILIAEGLWSAYLEVGIGPDPEVFTKAPVLASVGWGTRVGIPGFSSWITREQQSSAIVVWIEPEYRRSRHQAALDCLTPLEFETMMTTPVAPAA